MALDSGGRPAEVAASLGGFARVRQCVAGLLLVLGGLAALISLLLPWMYMYWPASHGPNPSFVPEMRAPVDVLRASLFSATWWPINLWLVCPVALPMLFVALGARLLLRREEPRLRWKVLALLASVLAFVALFLLAVGMGFSTIDSGAVQRAEVGEVIALWTPLAPFLAGVLMPTRRQRVRAAATW